MTSRRLSVGSSSKTRAKIARLRDNARRLIERVKASTFRMEKRRQSRLAWWRRAFRTPAFIGDMVWSTATSLWSAFMHLLGLAPRRTLATGRRLSPTAGRALLRGIMHEPLEDRRLLAVNITAPIAGDNIVNSLEQNSVLISGTSTIGSGGAVTVVVNDTNPLTPAVTDSAAVTAGGAWSLNLNLSGLDETALSVQAFGSDSSTSAPTFIQKDTVAPPVELPVAITSDDIINIAESSAVSVIGGTGAEPNSNVSITFTSTSGPAFSQTVVVQADANGLFNSLSQPVNLSGLQTGQTLSVSAVSLDAAQNVGSDARTVTLDLTAPPAPVISTPTAGQTFNSVQADAVVVSGTGAVPGGVVQLTFTGPAANQVSPPSVQADANGSFTFPAVNISALTDGNVTVSVSNVDAAGNPSTSQVIIVLDETGPSLTLDPIGGNDFVNAAEAAALVISGTSSDPGSTVNVSVSDGTNTVTGSAVVDAGGNFATTGLNVGSLNDGNITVTVTGNDANGNPSTPVTRNAVKDASPAPLQISIPIATDGIVNAAEANPLTINVTGIDTSSPAGTYSISGAGAATINGVLPNASSAFTISENVSAFNNGTLTITVTQTDSNGNVGTDTKTVTLDKTAPGAPSITAANINPNGVTVALPASGLTKDNTITYSGTAPESGTVTLFANGVAVGSAATTGSGSTKNWTITTSPLAEGTYTITARLSDAAGNQSPISAAFSPNVVVDTTAPSVSLTTPTAGQVFNAAAIAAGVSANGNAGDAVAVTLVFSNGASQVTTSALVTPGTPNTWSKTGIDLSSLPDGNIAILVTATDAAGNSQSITSSIVKDTVANTPVIATPIAGDNVVNISESNALVIQGAGAEPGQPVTLTFSKGATTQTVIIPAANASGGFISAPIVLAGFTGQGSGNVVTVTASTSDVNGNTSVGSASFVLDRVAPAPVKTADNWGANGINAAEQTKITLAGSGAEPGRAVTITFDDANASTPAVTKTVTAIASGADAGKFALVDPASSANLSALDDGPITITITSADAAGNSTTLTLPTVTKDSAAPFLSINNPVMGDNHINASEQSAVFIEGLAGGTGTALVGNQVTIEFKEKVPANPAAPLTLTTTATVTGVGYMISSPVDLTGFAEGEIVITVSATDVAGNAGSVSKTVTKDTLAPTLVVTSPAAGAVLGSTQSAGLVVTGTVSEAGATVNVQISDGVNPPVFKSVTATGNNFTLAGSPAVLTGLNDGPLIITVNAVDAAGNSSTETLSVVKDTQAPVVSINTPVSNGNNLINATEVSSVVIVGTVSGLAGAVTPVTVTFSDGTSTITKSVNTDASGNFTLAGSPANLSALNEGPITITASVTDAAGNTGTDSETATKDVSAPTLTIDNVGGADNVINLSEQGSLVISGTVSGAGSGAGVQLSIDGITQNVPIDSSGNYTWTLSAAQLAALAALPDGPWVVTASASDLAGNSASTTRSVDKDATPPSLTITAGQYAGGISSSEAAAFSLSGTVSDPTPNQGNLVGQTVTITLRDVNNSPATADVVLTGQVTAGPSNTFVFSTTAASIASLNNGNIQVLSATVTDKAGNTFSLPASITYALDKVAPPAPVITDASGSLANGSLTKNNLPVINGTVANNGNGVDSWNNNVGATVEISRDGTVLGTTTVQANGTFSFPLTTPLLDGARVFTAKVTDAAGNTSGTSNSFVLQIDTIAPNLQITTPVASDGKVNQFESQALVINGTGADPGMTVSITIVAPGGTITQSAVADANGQFNSTFDLSSVANAVASGNITIQASGTDLAGNAGLSTLVTVPIDTVRPAPTITAPIEVDNLVNAIEMLDVFVQGSGAEPGRPVVVTFTDSTNATVTRTVTAVASGANAGDYSLAPAVNLADLSALADGPITVSVTSLDLFGNAGSASSTITLDRVAPNIQITEPISGNDIVNQSEASTFSFVVTSFVNTENIVVTLTDSVPGPGGPNVHTVTLSPGNPGYPASSGSNAGKITINLNSTSLVDGAITLAVTNEDTAGNVGSDSVTFQLDRVAPTISIDNLGAIEGDNLINAAEADDVVITGQTDLPNTQVTVTFSDTSTGTGGTANVVKTVTTDATGKFTLATDPANILSQVNGAITITASITDPAGNTSTASTAGNNPTLDKTIGQITIGDPVAGNNVINGVEAGAVIVSGANAEPNRPVVVVFADQDAGTADVSRTVTADGSGNWSLATNVAGLASLTDTTNLVITATTSDLAGNTSSASKTVSLDKTAPAVTINAPAAGSYVTSSSVVVSGAGAEPNAQVSITIVGPNTSRTATVTASATGTYSNTFSLAAVASPAMSAFNDGTLTINVSTPDAAGNVGTANRSVVIDRTAPGTPSITVTSDTVSSLADGSFTNDNVLVISGSGLNSGGSAGATAPVASVEILNGSTVIGTATITGGSYSFTTSTLSDGLYNFRVRVTDDAGNSTTTANNARRVTVDTVAPSIDIENVISGDDQINASEVAAGVPISGTTVANTAVTVTVIDLNNVSLAKSTISDTNGDFTVNLTPADFALLANGQLTIIGETTDAANNTGFDVEIATLDKQAPTITIGSHTAASVINAAQAGAVNVTGALSDNAAVSGRPVTVTISDGTLSVTRTVNTAANGSYALGAAGLNVTSLADGPITITVESSDKAGNPVSKTVALTKDITSVNPSITTPIEVDNIVSATEQTTVEISGTGAEPNRPVTVVFSNGASSVTAFGAANAAGAYALNAPADLSSLPDGTVTVTVTTTDAAGNSGSNATTIVKDTTAPVVTTSLLTANFGGATVVPSSKLSSADISGPANITYFVTTSPAAGYLALVGNPAVQINSFTQEQINNGQVVYVSLGTANVFADAFSFSVSDAAGNTSTGTQNISLAVVDLPNVESVDLNGGQAQRSKLKTIEITFDQQVVGAGTPGAIVVQRRDDNAATPGAILGTVPQSGLNITQSLIGSGPSAKTKVTITFVPGNTYVDSTGSLVDGNYQVVVDAGMVSSLAGSIALDGNNDGVAGDDFVFGDEAKDNFFRMFGENNGGDATGFSIINNVDASGFFASYLNPPAYNSVFDSNEDGLINNVDASAFFARYLQQRNKNGFNP